MKIAIEAQRIFRKEKHGMDYVALETIRELQKIDQQNEYFILVSPGDDVCLYNPQIEMFARFKMKSSFHKTKRII